MKATHQTFILIFFAFSILFSSCKEDDNSESGEGQIVFSFNTTSSSGRTTEGIALDKVIISIENAAGVEILQDEEVALTDFDGSYESDPVSLVIGDYLLTKFLVVGVDGVVYYATPLESSDLAYLVEDPLPIVFSISEDDVVRLVPQVISTEEGEVEDFGYSELGFEIVETFDFLVGVFVFDETTSQYELTEASIAITGGAEPLIDQGLFATTNKVILPDRFETFSVEVSKSGYLDYSYSFDVDSIKQYQGTNELGPLEIILEEIDVPTNGLVAYYPFNGNANDESGNFNNGVVDGATLTTDRFGNTNSAYAFDGINDFIVIPHSESTNLSQSQNFSVSIWVNIPENQQDLTTTSASIMTKEGPADHSVGYPFVLRLWNSSYTNSDLWNAVYFRRWDGTTCGSTATSVDEHATSNQLAPNGWNHIVAVKNGSNILIYLNGELIDSTIDSTVDGCTTTNSYDWILGKREGNKRYFTGSLDDLMIYTRVLTDEEIKQLAFPNEGLVAYYPFNGNANDESENTNHGIVSGATLATDRFGNQNAAYSFDGVNDYIDLGNDDIFDLGAYESFTFSAWVNPDKSTISGQNETIFSKYVASTDDRSYAFQYINPNDVSLTIFENGVLNSFERIQYAITEDWNHIVWVYENGSISLFLNNVLASSKEFTIPIHESGSSANAVIGAVEASISDYDSNYQGLVDEIRIYSSALSSDEISHLFNSAQ